MPLPPIRMLELQLRINAQLISATNNAGPGFGPNRLRHTNPALKEQVGAEAIRSLISSAAAKG
jgi:hypothetical protein